MNLESVSREHPELKDYIDRILNEGINELFPPQIQALNTQFLKGANLLLCTNTSSGKTLIAELGIARAVAGGGKALYLCPLRSLATEKYKDLSKRYAGLMKVALSIGDYDKGDERLRYSDLIITSYEKFDSLMRHKSSWIRDLKLIVIDEVHLLNDYNRGPTLEVIMTRLKDSGRQLIALSATIGNPGELAEWINAELVLSDYRPVTLYEGVLHSGIVKFRDENREHSVKDFYELCLKTVSEGRQALVFVNARRSAEAEAERLGKMLKASDSSLNELSNKILKSLQTPTRQCRRLSACVLNGCAFNHAGLINKQKDLIEDAFRQGLIKVMVCTTVLAYGVSLPAYQVILRDLRRYTNEGLDYIPVSEYLQIKGRAGRAGYDKEGESVIVSKSEADYDKALSKYIKALPDEIISKLGVEPVLRSHALSLVSDGSALNIDSLINFFKSTFYARQYVNESALMDNLRTVVYELAEWGFIKMIGDKLMPTRLGERVAQLYIDPLSAKKLIDSLSNLKLNPLGFLHLISSTNEVPSLNLRQGDYEWILAELAINEDKLMIKTPNPFNYDYESFIKAFKTSLLFNEWISEFTEDDLLERYNVPPGTLHALLKNAEWMLYACAELSRITGLAEAGNYVKGLVIRLKYGVRDDLLSLVSLKGVGRVKARRLYKSGIKNVDDLRRADIKVVKRLIGSRTADKLFTSS